MSKGRRTDFRKPPPPPQALEHLQPIQPVYFFTPDLEREINKLEGVSSCRVLSDGAEIEEIHVIAPPDRTPKKIVRDIESLLLVGFGIRIDHRKVSVVQMGEAPEAAQTSARPMIQKVTRLPQAEGGGVSVQVRFGERTVSGVGRCAVGESDLYASSRGLINAIEKLLNTEGALALRHISVLRADQFDVMLAVLSWTLGGEAEVLVGASAARSDPLEDAARATFDAMNRKLVRAYRAG